MTRSRLVLATAAGIVAAATGIHFVLGNSFTASRDDRELEAALCVVIGIFWFEVPFRGTVVTLFVATALFLVVVLGIGFMISVAIPNQLGASQIAIIATLLPTNMLSGLAFPIDQMPVAIQAVTYLVWARYYVTILKAVFLKGSGVQALAGPLLALVVYATVVGIFATRAFRKTLT